MWESEISYSDVISEMCASTAIFRWKLNCKRKTWISLCLSPFLADRNSQKFGWISSWPRCSVQISTARWQWRPLHRLKGHYKAVRASSVKNSLWTFPVLILPFMMEGSKRIKHSQTCRACDISSTRLKVVKFRKHGAIQQTFILNWP